MYEETEEKKSFFKTKKGKSVLIIIITVVVVVIACIGIVVLGSKEDSKVKNEDKVEEREEKENKKKLSATEVGEIKNSLSDLQQEYDASQIELGIYSDTAPEKSGEYDKVIYAANKLKDAYDTLLNNTKDQAEKDTYERNIKQLDKEIADYKKKQDALPKPVKNDKTKATSSPSPTPKTKTSTNNQTASNSNGNKSNNTNQTTEKKGCTPYEIYHPEITEDQTTYKKVHHAEQGYWEPVVLHDAYDETVQNEDGTTSTVHHEAVTTQKWVKTQAEYDEEVPTGTKRVVKQEAYTEKGCR